MHWSNYLVEGLPGDRESEVTITIHAGRDNTAIVMLLSRLRGIVDALRAPATDLATDPLGAEDPEDLYYLLDHLHRVRMVLEGEEERVMTIAHERGVSLRKLATALEVSSPETVRYRLTQIRRAGTYGLTAAALDEDPMAAREPIVTDDQDHQ